MGNRKSKSLKPGDTSKGKTNSSDKKRTSAMLVPPAKDKTKRSSEISGPTKVTKGGNLPPELLQAMSNALMSDESIPPPSGGSVAGGGVHKSNTFDQVPQAMLQLDSEPAGLTQSLGGGAGLARGKPPGMAGNVGAGAVGGAGAGAGAAARRGGAPPLPPPLDDTTTVALYDYAARAENEMSITKGEVLKIIKKSNTQWWYVESTVSGVRGFAPTTYLKQ